MRMSASPIDTRAVWSNLTIGTPQTSSSQFGIRTNKITRSTASNTEMIEMEFRRPGSVNDTRTRVRELVVQTTRTTVSQEELCLIPDLDHLAIYANLWG